MISIPLKVQKAVLPVCKAKKIQDESFKVQYLVKTHELITIFMKRDF